MNLRSAFTLIELLITITIIAVLMGLLVVAGTRLRFNAMAFDTSQRMQGVLQAFSRAGQMEGSVALALQATAGLPGVTLFRQDDIAAKILAPQVAGESLLTSDSGHLFLQPWGKKRLDGSAPSPRTLAQLDPTRTVRLMLAVNHIATAADYQDRNPRALWNDRWGSPLVIGYGIYQPNTFADMRQSLTQYQYNRSIYVSVAACGPVRRSPDDSDSALATALTAAPAAPLARLWTQVTDVCKATDWRVDAGFNAMDNPPWEGVRRSDKGDERCFLSAPLELK